jgi:PKD repeat protein
MIALIGDHFESRTRGMMGRRKPGSGRGAVLATLIAVSAALVGSFVSQVAATTGDIGMIDQSFSGVTNPPTSDKPQSKLWFNDGLWWADMFDSASQTWHIFRLDRPTKTWVDTGTRVDDRPQTLSDALWDGQKLYVASQWVTISTTEAPKASVQKPARLYRYSYVAATKSYVLDAGFPAVISNNSSESLTIDKDSTGRIWATWTQVSGSKSTGFTNAVYVNSSATGAVWGTPTVLPVQGAHPGPDDISGVVAYATNKIGVMWSNHLDDSVYWAVRTDGQPLTNWTGSVAVRGSKQPDDHLNLKTIQSDQAGRVFAAVKTSLDELSGAPKSSPQINLLVFKPGTGSWSSTTFGTLADCHTRPIVVLDDENSEVHVFATAPTASGCAFSGAPGTIYEKTAPMDNPVFAPGRGTPVIRDAASANMNNPTSTKQSVNSSTGLVVLASNTSTKRYWHADLPLAHQSATVPAASFTASPTSGTAPLTVQFTDTSTNSPSSWSWNFGDGSTSTQQNPSTTFTTAGTYTVTMTASNAAGTSAPATATITVSTAPVAPTASFTASPASGDAPLTVQFTDTSTNSPSSWSWNFGNGSTSTQQNPSTTYTSAGTYTVTMTASNAAGTSAPATKTITVTAAPTAPTASFTASPTSGDAPLTVQFTDTSTGNPTSWAWDFGDGSTSSQQNPSATFTTPGTYTVTLIASNSAGPSAPATRTITVTAAPTAPTASFTASPTSGDAPLTVQFTDTSTGNPTSWAWDFGDGSTSTQQNPSTTYSTAGTYTVSMTASNAAGTSAPATKTITVTSPPPPAQIVRAGSSTSIATTADTGLTIAQPAGTSAGDVLVACLALNGSSVASTGAPTGWTKFAGVTTISNPRVYGYYKVAGASEPASYRWGFSSSITSAGGIARYTGAAGLDGTASTAAGASATSGTVPGVTTSAANAMLVGCMGINSGATTITIAGPAGMSEAWDLGGKRNELDDALQATAGASGSKTWTFSAGREWAGWLAALTPR